jgi:urease gamma subunit
MAMRSGSQSNVAGGQRAGPGATAAAAASTTASAHALPIMDEVNELIEKEKLLLEFKVLEQQKEAHGWKLKYDSLLGKISENVAKVAADSNAASAVATAGYQVLEEAAVAEEKASSAAYGAPSSSSSASSAASAAAAVAGTAAGAVAATPAFDEVTSSLADFIYKTGDYYTLDMSGKPASFVAAQLTSGVQVLKRYSTALKAVYLAHCGLTDEHAAIVCRCVVPTTVVRVCVWQWQDPHSRCTFALPPAPPCSLSQPRGGQRGHRRHRPVLQPLRPLVRGRAIRGLAQAEENTGILAPPGTVPI